ncbi:MAG: FkbM family methyltransferase [Pseudomonadota bacterium]
MFDKFKWTEVARQRLTILRNYEPLQPYIIRQLSQVAGVQVFVDIGANIGAYSMMMSDSVPEIHAFEPNPPTLLELKLNVELNKLSSRIEIHDVALSDKEGVASFGVVGTYSGANGLADTSIHEKSKFVKEIPVRCARLDLALPALRGKTIAFKVDVEGHEISVLAGATEILGHSQALIQIENYDRGNDTIQELLHSLGYQRILRIGPDNYYTNIPGLIECRTVLTAMEDAVSQLIADQLAPAGKSAPVRLGLPGFAVEVSGTGADVIRKIKATLKEIRF